MSKSKLSNLLKGRSVPNLPSYTSPWNKHDEKLWNGVKQQNIKQVKTILSKTSVTPTKLGPQGKSAFHLACELGNEQIVDAILASAQDVNDTTIQGVTALQRAAAKGHTSTVNKLLKKQANVDQRDCNGMTALHHACFGQHKDCVKTLLINNADINAYEQGGKTPLFYSAHLGHFDISKWLLQRGADVNCQDKDNVTPLMLAAKEGHKDVCELLLKSGANPSLTDRYDKTALEYAVASKHLELQEVFAKSYKQGYDLKTPRSSISVSLSGSLLSDDIDTVRPSPNHSRSAPFEYENERARPIDVVSIHSMDDCLLPNHQLPPMPARRIMQTSSVQVDETSPKSVYKEQAHETIAKSVYGSATHDTVVKSIYGKETDETEAKSFYRPDEYGTVVKSVYGREAHETVPMSAFSKEGAGFQERVEEQEKMFQDYKAQKQTVKKQVSIDGENNIANKLLTKEVIDTKHESNVTVLSQQIGALKKENEQLKASVLSNRNATSVNLEMLSDRLDHSQLEVGKLTLEKEQLEKQISQLLARPEQHEPQKASDQEEVVYQNEALTKEVGSLRLMVDSLQEELQASKSEAPTDAQRLDAILAASANFEEVNFDEEGFVEGRDVTKEEFLQGQNQELKTQCGRLTVELEKLRLTFDAILKAGDNLQSDYDHLATEKDALQDELETTLKEKRDVITENEFLLADNNELHGNLKKIVHELEKMQEKFQATHAENEELKRSVNVAGKVGEVARLLEEKDVLQQKCAELETTSQRLQHDHDILLEEVQSLNESLNQMTGQRNQLAADLEEFEPIYQQHEALQIEYTQLEMEFAELLREKEVLEQRASNNNEEKEETIPLQMSDGPALDKTLKQIVAEKQQLELEKHQLELEKQELEDVVNGLSRHIVATEHVVKDLENNLEQARSTSGSQNLERNGLADEDDIKSKGTHKDSEEVIHLKKQIALLTLEVEDWEKKHADTVTTYRTHLLSAVQGHMDPDVKDALYHIIELRSMEQFC